MEGDARHAPRDNASVDAFMGQKRDHSCRWDAKLTILPHSPIFFPSHVNPHKHRTAAREDAHVSPTASHP